MVQIEGKYKFVKQENFVEHLTAFGLPEDQVQAMSNRKPNTEFKIDGNKITVSSDSGAGTTYILGKEIEEKTPVGGQILKSVAKLEGDTLTVTSTHDAGSGRRIYKFSDSGFVLTLNNDNPKIPQATRIYERI